MSDSTPGRGGNYQKEASTRTNSTCTDFTNERYSYHHGATTLHETSRTQNFGSTGPNSTIRTSTETSVPDLFGGTPIAEEVGNSKNPPGKLTMAGRNVDDDGKSGKIKAGEEAILRCNPKRREGPDAPIRDTGNDGKISGDRGGEFFSISGDSNDGGASMRKSSSQAKKDGSRSERSDDGNSLIWLQKNEDGELDEENFTSTAGDSDSSATSDTSSAFTVESTSPRTPEKNPIPKYDAINTDNTGTLDNAFEIERNG